MSDLNINYADYLGSQLWPTSSVRNADGGAAHRDVVDMPPQYAASALHKLAQWARNTPQGDLVTINDVDQRELTVRQSRLGQLLAMRACSLHELELLHAIFGDQGDIAVLPAATFSSVTNTVYNALEHTNPLANAADLVGPTTHLVTQLLTAYDIKVKR